MFNAWIEKKEMKKQLFNFCAAVLAFLLISAVGVAQQVTNVRARQEDKKIIITYDLTGGESGQTFTVKLLVSEDGGYNWKGPLKAVTGDAGSGVSAGYNRQLVWDVLAEPGRDKLQGDRIGFKVRAEYVKPGSGSEPEMVYIQGGTFQMGSNESDDEKPVHSVTVGSLYMGKYEVTQKQWEAIMDNNPSSFSGCDNCPVERVSWNDVQEFIQKLNQRTGKDFRLPTEAEWEYAARGGNQSRGYTYSGSNNVDEVAWYTSNSGSKTHPVGQKRANELGLYDMSGNVWEWCSDWYGSDYYRSSPATNPKGPSSGPYRVYRGGSWGSIPEGCRAAIRGSAPADRGIDLGFRLVYVP